MPRFTVFSSASLHFLLFFYCVFCDVLPVIVACRHARVCLGGGVGGVGGVG